MEREGFFLTDLYETVPSKPTRDGQSIPPQTTPNLHRAHIMEKGKRVCVAAAGWADLSPEILALIFVRISPDEMSRTVPCVCSAWREAAVGPYCWEDIDIEQWCRRVDKVEVIDPAVRELIRRSGNSCGSVCAYRVGDSCFPAFASAGKFLSVLQIPMSEVTDGMVEMHAPSLSALTVLDISCCLKITFIGIEALGKHCRSLVQLKRNMPPEVDHSQQGGPDMKGQEEEAISVANTMPRLQHLELAYARFTDHGLNAITTKCESLRLLDIRGCWNVKFHGDLLQRCVLIPDFSAPWEDDTKDLIESDESLSEEDDFNENDGYLFDGDTSVSESEDD